MQHHIMSQQQDYSVARYQRPCKQIYTKKIQHVEQETLCLPEVLTVRVFEVTLLPQPCQNRPTLPLQFDQSAVLKYILHQSPLVHHALLHNLSDKTTF